MSKMGFAMFMAGATVGVAGSWLFCKKHYEQIAQEEIDSVKASYSGKKFNPKEFESKKFEAEDDKKKADMAKLKPDIVNYAAKLKEQRYTNYSAYNDSNTTDEERKPMDIKPFVISPDEFGDGDNTTISLTYYSDGTLADDEDNIMEDIESTVGSDFADHFGEYDGDDDSVFVRNNRLKCDYEILRDNRSYDDVVGMYQYDMED